MKRKIILLISVSLLIYMASYASTPEAWEKFEQDIRRLCEGKVKDRLVNPNIVVDPYAPSVGIAIAEGQARYSKDDLIIICIYDKRTKEVEIGSEPRLIDSPWYKKLLDENEKMRKEITELRDKLRQSNSRLFP